MVQDGTLYLFPDHDEDKGANNFNLKNCVLAPMTDYLAGRPRRVVFGTE